MICTLAVFIILFNCTDKNSSIKNKSTETLEDQDKKEIKITSVNPIKSLNIESDTVLYYWDVDASKVYFDTIIKSTNYNFKMYSLNDSALYNRVITDARRKNKKLVEYDVSHNYKIDFQINPFNGNKITFSITKETFKDNLPAEFIEVASIRNNKFLNYKNEKLNFKATLAQPDTDYQMAVIYSISKIGEFRIVEVIDESYNGSEE